MRLRLRHNHLRACLLDGLRFIRKTSAALVSLVLLVACGRIGSGNSEPSVTGGSLVVGLPEIGPLDPVHATSPSALTILRTACNGLVGLDHETGAPEPALAGDWTVLERGRKFRLSVPPERKFSDGTPVTPEAVREALSRVARPDTSSPWASLVARVEGFPEVQTGAATHLSGVRVLEESQLEITLSEPFSGFPTVLAHPALLPVSLESLKETPEGAALPVCSGPFTIEPGAGEKDLRLGKVSGAENVNEAYLDSGKGKADLIIVRSFDSGEDAYAAYQAGQVDIAPVPDSRVGEAQSQKGFRSEAIPRLTYLAFDKSNPATADPRVRQAISLSVDRLAILDAAYGDQRQPAGGWLPEHLRAPGQSECSTYVRQIADPDKAQELFAPVRAGLPQLTLYYDNRTTGRLIAEALEIQIEQTLGIAVQPTPLEGQDVETHLNTRPPGAAAWIMATKIDLGLPDEYLGAGPAAGPLTVEDPDFISRIIDARSATTSAQIQERYSLAESELCRLMPGVPLWTDVSRWMFSPERVDVESETFLDSLGSPLLRHSFALDG